MTGTVTVFGTYSYPGAIAVGLTATAPPPTGCRDARFTGAPAAVKPTSVMTTGDGTYAFRTPVAPRNLCYAVTATLSLKANPAVRADHRPRRTRRRSWPGCVLSAPSSGDIPNVDTDSMLRPALAFGVAYALVLGVALFVMLRAAFGARHDARSVWPLRPGVR